MKITPLGKKVAIQPDAAESKTTSGLFIAAKTKEYPSTGTIVSIGEGVTTVKVGQKVVYPRYAVVELRQEDENSLITIEESLILATLED